MFTVSAIAEERDQDAQSDRGFGGGIGHDKDREHLPVQSYSRENATRFRLTALGSAQSTSG